MHPPAELHGDHPRRAARNGDGLGGDVLAIERDACIGGQRSVPPIARGDVSDGIASAGRQWKQTQADAMRGLVANGDELLGPNGLRGWLRVVVEANGSVAADKHRQVASRHAVRALVVACIDANRVALAKVGVHQLPAGGDGLSPDVVATLHGAESDGVLRGAIPDGEPIRAARNYRVDSRRQGTGAGQHVAVGLDGERQGGARERKLLVGSRHGEHHLGAKRKARFAEGAVGPDRAVANTAAVGPREADADASVAIVGNANAAGGPIGHVAVAVSPHATLRIGLPRAAIVAGLPLEFLDDGAEDFLGIGLGHCWPRQSPQNTQQQCQYAAVARTHHDGFPPFNALKFEEGGAPCPQTGTQSPPDARSVKPPCMGQKSS